MPHKKHKKFRKFIAVRHGRLQHVYDVLATGRNRELGFLRAVRLPLLMGITYGLLGTLNVLSIIYPLFHYLALGLFLLWIIQAIRGELGFWSHRSHLRFFFPIAVLVFVGSCWGGLSSDAAKAWVTPPAYTNKPSEQLLADRPGGAFLSGSTLHVGWQGKPQRMIVHFAGKQERLESLDNNETATSLIVPHVDRPQKATLMLQKGWRRLALWTVEILPDKAPSILMTEPPEVTSRGAIRLSYEANDDYGIETVIARITPTNTPPGSALSPPLEITLAKPVMKHLKAIAYTDMTQVPWAGQVVSIQLIASDGAGNKGWSAPQTVSLPTRVFHNPFAKALIEEKNKLISQPDAAVRDEAANVMAGIARQQGIYHGDKVVMMTLRAGAARLVLNQDESTVSSVAQILWQMALRLEEGVMGLARADLSVAERDLSFALMRLQTPQSALPYWTRLQESMAHYLEVLEAERARQPPALQELDWPLATAQEMLAPEDLQNRVIVIGVLINKGDASEARDRLEQLQTTIESLRTAPPDLTPAQSMLAQQISALRALVRGQKALNEEIDRMSSARPQSTRERKTIADGMARSLAQQQLLVAAMRDVMGQSGLSVVEGKIAIDSMKRASSALQKKELSEVQINQANALALLQNILLSLSDQMKRALTVQAPEKEP